jgi:cell division control protein 7
MSPLRAAPAGVLELQRSSSYQVPQHPKHRFEEVEEAREVDDIEESRREENYEEEVDESVREDMSKLEDTFPGIIHRFRLVNRIGEGIFSSRLCPTFVKSMN